MSNNKTAKNTSSNLDSFKIEKLFGVIIFLVSFIFYWNAIPNETALDDVMVLTNNQFVLQGIEGVPDILKHESFYGATGKISSQLSWRYRPLSLIVFAIEHELFGNNWSAYHFINILLYALLCFAIYNFIKRHIFPDAIFIAFCAALIFTVHPMHTEVVANIKSLDEILALLFSVLFLNSFLNYNQIKNIKSIAVTIIFLILALLSKESSATLLVIAPLAMLVFTKDAIKDIILKSIPLLFTVLLFTFIRMNISDIPATKVDIMNDPYLLATTHEKFATISLILGKYIGLLIAPINQCIEYGYNQIPYVTFSNILSITSLAFHVAVFIFSITQLIKRKPIGFATLSYLISIIILSNILINIGPPMADRFLFMPSFFFVIIIAILFESLQSRINKSYINYASLSLLTCFVLFSFVKVYARNKDWKNNETLYKADIIKSPNSVRMLTYHAGMLINQTDSIQDSLTKSNKLKTAINNFEKAYSIYKSYANMYQNWGLSYYRINNIDSAEWAWNRLKQLKPDSKFVPMNDTLLATTRFNIWNKKYEEALPRQNYAELLPLYRNAISYYDVMPGSWVLIGKLYFVNNKKDSATWAWNECLKRDPGNVEAKKLLANPVW